MRLSSKRYQLIVNILCIICILLAGALAWVIGEHRLDKEEWQNAKIIVISKQELKLRVFDYKGQCLFEAPCAVGLAAGNKEQPKDNRTPEGIFQLQDKQNAQDWIHDFKDGNGEIEGAYGPRFLRINVPGQKGIGIHGTHLPESIGTRSSEGCIRLKNEDVLALDQLVTIPCLVIITPGYEDAIANGNEAETK